MKEYSFTPLSSSSICFLLFAKLEDLTASKHGLKKWLDYVATIENKVEVIVAPIGKEMREQDLLEIKLAAEKYACSEVLAHLKILPSCSQSEGDAFRLGFAYSAYEIVVVAPLLPSFCQPSVIKIMLQNIEQSHVAGAVRVLDFYPLILRFLFFLKAFLGRFFLCIPFDRISGPDSFWARFQSWIFWFIFGVRYIDPFFPVRVYRRHVLETCFPVSKGNFFQLEILAKANFLGLLFFPEQSWPETYFKSTKGVIPDRGDIFCLSDFLNLLSNPDFSTSQPPLPKVAVNNGDLAGSDAPPNSLIPE
ncbi:MAG: hypothetical protein EBT92_05695 [Planctomycetes bacterium]|nr:hypothetical protein [Planctomycetota bacterium]